MEGSLDYPELSELMERLRWFIQLRWAAIVSVLLAVAVVSGLLMVPLAVLPILATTAAIALYNTFFWLQLRTSEHHHVLAQRAQLYANLQIAFDLVALTVLLHFTAGVENPFYLFYLFHVIIASILLSPLATFLQGSLAVILFAGLALLEYAGVLPHVPVYGLSINSTYRQAIFLLTELVAFALTVYIGAYLATSITRRLRQRERQIIELKNRLEEEDRRLQVAYAHLQDTERAKSQFMRKVSHELRAPLAAVESLLATVLQGYAGPIPSEPHDLLARASARARELLNMVNDLLVLSRMREARLDEARESVPIGKVSSHVVALFRPQAAEKGLTLETRIPERLPDVPGDRVTIEELLSNLLSNAIKYTRTGGKVVVEVSAGDGQVEIRVSDTGIGMTPDEVARIFEEYYRTERARQLVPEGTGLGMSIVKSIVDRLGGSVQVRSQPNEGTVIDVRLPARRLQTPNQSDPGHAASAREAQGRG